MKCYIIGLLRTTNKPFGAPIRGVFGQCNEAHVRRGFTNMELPCSRLTDMRCVLTGGIE
jgi:hypothetical protein